MMLRFGRNFARMFATAVLAACAGSPSAPNPSLHSPSAISILVLGKASSDIGMGVGVTLPLSAVVTDALGDTLRTATVLWSSSNPGVLSVDSTGTVVAVSEGYAEARAAVAGTQPPVTDSLQVIVANLVGLVSRSTSHSGAQLNGRGSRDNPLLRLFRRAGGPR